MSDAEILALTANLGASVYQSLTIFQVEKKIGKGQFSVVYRARCRSDGAIVALKKVQIFEMMDARARLDCMKEINLLQVGLPLLSEEHLPPIVTNFICHYNAGHVYKIRKFPCIIFYVSVLFCISSAQIFSLALYCL
jgi:serine/threonine protein kinase